MAAQPFNYSGQGFSLQRDKARFVLPPAFRKVVRASSDNTPLLCLAKHDRWTCLIGFGTSHGVSFPDQLDREEALALQQGREFDRDMRAMQLTGYSDVPFDDSGRFVLPSHLGELGAIGDQLYFQAAGPFFVMFAPDELYKMGPGFEGAQAACRMMQAEARKAKKP